MKRHFLPALRGLFGDWAYYSCLISLKELATRVKFADQIHQSKALSDLRGRPKKKVGNIRDM
jgi:DNA sulfur modification protein DndB